MFDVFYIGPKPNAVAHEREVNSIEEAQELSRTRFFWIVDYLCDYTNFDFLWEPVPWEAGQRHAFSSQHQKDSGTYLCPRWGSDDINYHTEVCIPKKANEHYWNDLTFADFDYTWHPDPTEPPMIYKFGTQWQKTGGPIYTVPGASNVKYVRENRVNKTTVDPNWIIPDNMELDGFDYTWHPDSSEPPYNYQFGTQWQKTGGPLYQVSGAQATKYVTQASVKSISIAKEVYLIDHGNQETEQVKQQLESKGLAVKKVARFISSYKGTLQRILGRETNEYVWVCSSVCDYSNFDFSWHPELWQGTMLHVFSSNEEKFGDTFLVNTTTFNERIGKTEILEWYDTIHFVDNISVPRWPLRTVHYDSNSLVDPVMQHTFSDPLVLFTDDNAPNVPTIPLWREKTRTITPLNTGNSIVIVPRDAKTAIKAELYDYPQIDTTYRTLSNNKPLDVVFISNGEKIAEKNWSRLQQVLTDRPNRLVRIDGVNGRAAAYHAALRASETPWAFCVFAKLTVDENFDWSWQPDRMQKNKHYIFHARNPVNGLEYGHMAMIAYHKDLVLVNDGSKGLDFTLDQEHEVVPVLSGVANYADDVWTAWRSAFREALKLRNDQTTIDNQYRLKIWTTRGEGEIGEWSVKGACDAVEYWESVAGDFDKLKLSYEWSWLREYFVNRYGFEPDQQ
jgi:hypothetical protein